MYEAESKVLQYFANLFTSLFKLQQKQLSIQNRSHHVTPSEATFQPILWFHDDTSSLVFESKESLHWRLHLLLIVEVSQVQDVNNGLEQVMVFSIFPLSHLLDKYGTKPFLRWVWVQSRSPHASGISKNTSDPVSIPLKGVPQAPGNKPSSSKEG